MRVELLFIGAAFLLGTAAFLTHGSDTTRVQELSHYCEMRDIHRESQGEYGWPAEAHSKFDDGDCK